MMKIPWDYIGFGVFFLLTKGGKLWTIMVLAYKCDLCAGVVDGGAAEVTEAF